jgi:hypothetical protein
MTPAPPPQPQAKKSNVLLWVLIGVGGCFALIVILVVAGGLFLAHQVRQSGGMQINSGEGTIQIGGAAKIPAWVPGYPGSNPRAGFAAQGKDGRTGTFTFETKESADHVAKYYRDQLEASGFKITSVLNSGSSQVVTAQDTVKLHTVVVVAAVEGHETTVSVTYSNK